MMPNQQKNCFKKTELSIFRFLSFLLSTTICIVHAADIPIEQSPLSVRNIDSMNANLFLLIDDSGSMGDQTMPDTINNDNECGRTLIFDGTSDLQSMTKFRCLDPTYNLIYFSPEGKYPVPLDHEGNPLGDSDYKNAWRQGFWDVIDKKTNQFRDKYTQDLRLSRPYKSGSTSYTGHNSYSNTEASGAWRVYLNENGTSGGKPKAGTEGQNVVCKNSRTPHRNETAKTVFYDCATLLPSTTDFNKSSDYSSGSHMLSKGAPAWFSTSAEKYDSYDKGFVCASHQLFHSGDTRSTYHGNPKPEANFYFQCIDLDKNPDKAPYSGYRLANKVFNNDSSGSEDTRSEVFLSIYYQVGNDFPNGGEYENGFICRTRFGHPSHTSAASSPRNKPLYLYADCDIAPGNKKIKGYRISDGFSYIKRKSGSPGSTNASHYEKVYVRSEDIWQKAANWYSYYRYRMQVTRAAFSFAFSDFPENYYIAWDTTGSDLGGSTPRFDMKKYISSKAELYKWTFHLDAPNWTPLRRALSRVGRYLQQSKQPWATDPSIPHNENTNPMLSCRNNFAVMLTDGYWKDGAYSYSKLLGYNVNKAEANSPGKKIDHRDPEQGSYTYMPSDPYRDIINTSEQSLADVAMYYWKTDLSDLPNDVKPVSINSDNPDIAFWQHLNSSFLGLGVQPVSITRENAFKAALNKTRVYWPDHTKDNNKIDDMLHAAINGHGNFYSGMDVSEFIKGFSNIILAIKAVQTGATSLTSNEGKAITNDLGFYHANFQTYSWKGEISAYSVGEDGSRTLIWNASNGIPASGQRNIVTWVDNASKPFLWNSLNGMQRQNLGSEDIVNYIRGDQSKEEAMGGPFRDRESDALLGDIVNSTPLFVGPPDPDRYQNQDANTAHSYSQYAKLHKNRTPMLYVGANDGMLHAFNASLKGDEKGDEIYAYIPGVLLEDERLRTLADPEYGQNHYYFVDGELTSEEVFLDGAWKTVLVGTLGRGGKTVFALDVTDPGNQKVLWETSPEYMGNYDGKPAIVQLQNHGWVVLLGNGYDSEGDDARLLALDLATGNSIDVFETLVLDHGTSTDPSGLSSPLTIDLDGDGNVDRIYAGDLHGNMWRIMIVNGEPKASKLFAAGKSKPITSMPLAVIQARENTLWIYFGTGKWHLKNDVTSNDVQTWYGLKDKGGTINDLSKLNRIVLTREEQTKTGKTIRHIEYRPVTSPLGWYMNLKLENGIADGEKMIMQNTFHGGVIIGYSMIPVSANSCTATSNGLCIRSIPFPEKQKIILLSMASLWPGASVPVSPQKGVSTRERENISYRILRASFPHITSKNHLHHTLWRALS